MSAWVHCVSLLDASTLRLSAVGGSGSRKSTVAGGANLNLRVIEFPIINMCCLILSAGVGEARRPSGLPAGQAMVES